MIFLIPKLNISKRPNLLVLIVCFLALARSYTADAQQYTLNSPNGHLQVRIMAGRQLVYWLDYQGRLLLDNCTAALHLSNGTILGREVQVRQTVRRSGRDSITAVVPEKRRRIPDRYEELTLHFKGSYSVVFRAYDDGFAYRFVTTFKDSLTILREDALFRPSLKGNIYYPAVNKRDDADIFHTSFEAPYQALAFDSMPAQHLAFSPVLLTAPAMPRMLITESDLLDYPGMFLQATFDVRGLKGIFAPYPAKIKKTDGEFPQYIVTERQPYIARCRGDRSFPWRVVCVAPTDADLLMNDLVYRLATPCRLIDTDWIRPGKSTEEWIIGANIYNVPFESGINTQTYKYYIDFAQKVGFQYVMLDAGWSDVKDLFRITPGMDMEAISAYAREKGVGLILWTLSMTLERQLDSALEQFQRWGVNCIMTDFMDRDDQVMVGFYERIAEATARRRIMAMFHGAFKPAGLQRTYPNIITREAVLGSEYNVWSSSATPEHDLLLPFIRQPSGPMDYEPGILDNATEKTFRPIAEKVMSQGTRTHQLAMFVVYESPLQMFSGNPSAGLAEPAFMELLGSLPTVWDETRVLKAKLSDHVVVARRNGDDWYIGAMNDWTPFQTEIALDFLPEGRYWASICADGVNAHRYASDYTLSEMPLSRTDRLNIRLAPGGGWVARLIRE